MIAGCPLLGGPQYEEDSDDLWMIAQVLRLLRWRQRLAQFERVANCKADSTEEKKKDSLGEEDRKFRKQDRRDHDL